MAFSREEQLRNSRRLMRQLVGLVVVLLVVIGLITVVGWCIAGVRTALDDSDRKENYATRLYGLVLFDPLPFADAAEVDQNVFKQAAIWGTVYQIQQNGTLDSYERDAATGCVILPRLEVDAYIASLLGPDFEVEPGAFETQEMNYLYDEEKQGYLVPVTGSVGLYTPVVEDITTRAGLTYVTVGYIPTQANVSGLEVALTAPTEPTKYMDYVFARGENRQWYLTALQESAVQPETSSTSASSQEAAAAQDPQALVESALNNEAAGSTAAPEETPSEAVADEAAADGAETGEPAPEEGAAAADAAPEETVPDA